MPNENMNINAEVIEETIDDVIEINPRTCGVAALLGIACGGLVVVAAKFLGPKITEKYSRFKDSRDLKKAEKNGVETVEAEVVEETETK